jgi:hypothetical protein
VLLMTVLIVFSGFVGRYFYTAIPRSVDGIELEASQIRSQIQAAEAGSCNTCKTTHRLGGWFSPCWLPPRLPTLSRWLCCSHIHG